jgi:transcriptional regulator with XRE-family HTH domain
MILHKEIKRIRKELNLSQLDFSKKIGISRVHYNNIEKCKCFPTLDLLQKIEFATGKKLIVTFIDSE